MMSLIPSLLTYLVLYFLAITNGAECALFTSEQEQAINSVIMSAMECRNIPGLSLAVVKGEESWTKGYGVADMPSGTPVDENTAFLTGSLGKALTMTLLGGLLEEHGFNWDTKLADIEGLNLKFHSEELTREITPADMLCHRKGLSSISDFGFIGQYPTGTDIRRISERLEFLPEHWDFRSRFMYNNMMYVMCAHVTEVLGQDSWENLLTSRVFQPAGMTSTFVIRSDTDVHKEGVAKPYILLDDVMQNGTFGIYKMTPLEPAGIIFSTAVDMASWIKVNLRQGRTESGEQLVAPEVLDSAFMSQVDVPSFLVYRLATPQFPVNDNTTGYGYAWFVSTYRGYHRVWHSGGLFSYVSLIWLFPDQNIGIYASINGPALPSIPAYGLNAIFSYISDILLGEEPWIDAQTACTFPSPWRNNIEWKLDKQPEYSFTNLNDFVGTYGNYMYLFPDVDVVLSEDSEEDEQLRLVMNQMKGDLLPQDTPDHFAFNMTQPWEYAVERYITENITITYPVVFSRNADGIVESFNFTVLPTSITFRKDVRFNDFSSMQPNKATSCMSFTTFVVLAMTFLGALMNSAGW